MEKYEALWAYQTEDMKADAIANAIKRSPSRQKLEKARDFILDRQKKYKQIEEDVSAMVDRKDIIAQAVDRAREQLQVLQTRYENEALSTPEEVKALLSEVSRCRDTIRQYEAEISRIVKETDSNDKLQRSVRLEAANAKKAFDQLKADYEEESKSKKGELDAQRAKARELMDQVDPALLYIPSIRYAFEDQDRCAHRVRDLRADDHPVTRRQTERAVHCEPPVFCLSFFFLIRRFGPTGSKRRPESPLVIV